ncbi:hypothetical protein ANO11243_091920 [Dothideomycetidae sp. 11243]|nr:hypothetical protein ANO11243_091920 [fungal sp. No.11243]
MQFTLALSLLITGIVSRAALETHVDLQGVASTPRDNIAPVIARHAYRKPTTGLDTTSNGGTDAQPGLCNYLGLMVGVLQFELIAFAQLIQERGTVQAVIEMLKRHRRSRGGSQRGQQNTEQSITEALEQIAAVIFTQPLPKDTTGGMQSITVGADDGKEKFKRETSFLDYPVDTTTWDLSDDVAHPTGSVHHDKRTVVSDKLRVRMLEQGRSNITFLHIHGATSPTLALVYHEGDTTHYHWRPSPAENTLSTRSAKHHPYFDADGAGFKISAAVAVDRRSVVHKPEEAKTLAKIIVSDLMKKRTKGHAVGYLEVDKRSCWVGRKLCIIAEPARFNLKSEVDLCFPKK